MAVKFRDYYEVLGIPRTASQDEIQRAFRKLARKYHPDVNKAANAEERFKEINEAYEVLKDPEKRKKYDQLGPDWKTGQEFRPPPGWESQFDFGQAGGGAREFHWGGGSGFSDFFEALFGGQRQRGPYGGVRGGGQPVWNQAGADQEATVRVGLEDIFHGATRTITLQMQRMTPQGIMSVQEKSYDVKIPAGILPGQKIRLSGQGGEGMGSGPRGDLYLVVEIEPNPVCRLTGRDLSVDLLLSPWEAVLGAEVQIPTLSGPVTLKVPAGTQSGQKLRLKGKGLPNPKGAAGDLYVVVSIVVPKNVSARERELFEQLQAVSGFNPRH